MISPFANRIGVGSPPSGIPQRRMHLEETQNLKHGFAEYTCSLVSDGGLTYNFDPDPQAFLLDSAMDVQVELTRGGQIAYPKYRSLGPLTIQGYLRNETDLIFLKNFVQMHHREAIYEGSILHFIYPERDIDLGVYIRRLPNVGIDHKRGGIVLYQLICEITRDHTALSEIPLSELGIPEDVEWIDPQTAANMAESMNPGITFGAGDSGLDSSGNARGSEPPS